jgi:PAS domain S-box-containing protein
MHSTIPLPDRHHETDPHDCFYRALVDRMPDLITVLDESDTTQFTNPASITILGQSPDDRAGRSLIQLVHPDDVPLLREALEAAVRSDEPSQAVEHRCRHSSGEWRILESISRRSVGEDGSIRLLVHSRDATERRAREEQRLHAEALEAVGRVSVAIGRDFSDLLIVLSRHVAVLESSHAAGVRGDAFAMRKALDQARVLVDQLLAFDGMAHSGNAESADVNDAIETLADDLERLAGPGVEITHLLGATSPRVRLSRATLDQLLVALVAYARDTLSAGRLTLLTRNTTVAPSRDAPAAARIAEHLVIELTDSGIGLPAGAGAEIVEPTFTAEGREPGLPAVFRTVRRSGGRISIDSDAQSRTTVRVLLPVADEL